MQRWSVRVSSCSDLGSGIMVQGLGTRGQGQGQGQQNVSAIRADTWSQMWPQRMAPDAAMMVLRPNSPRNIKPQTTSAAPQLQCNTPTTPLWRDPRSISRELAPMWIKTSGKKVPISASTPRECRRCKAHSPEPRGTGTSNALIGPDLTPRARGGGSPIAPARYLRRWPRRLHRGMWQAMQGWCLLRNAWLRRRSGSTPGWQLCIRRSPKLGKGMGPPSTSWPSSKLPFQHGP